MARDEALALLAARTGTVTLRLYRFVPTAVTAGRFQRLPGSINMPRCRQEGIDIVRRPTGGAAILHINDFTYSFVMPRKEGRASEKEHYFGLIAGSVLRSLEIIGIDACIASRVADDPDTTWCFGGVAGVDLECNGGKICGSAQRIYDCSVLQHGSLFLETAEKVLGTITEAGKASENSLKTIREAAGRVVEWNEMRDAFLHGFAEALGVNVEYGCMDDRELALAVFLEREKYASREWLWSGRTASRASPDCDNMI